MIIRPYSPTQTMNWLRCPVLRDLRRNWEPKVLGNKELAGLLGSGFAAGVAVYNKSMQHGLQLDVKMAVSVGTQYVTDALTRLRMTHVIDDRNMPLRDNIIPRLTRMLEAYPDQDPIPSQWVVLDVEGVLPSNSRIDLGMETNEDNLVVIDYKTKVSLDVRYRNIAITEWRDSWQMHHYAWEYGVGTPGRWPGLHGRAVTDYYIVLAICEPRPKFELLPFTISPEAHARWEDSAWRVWEQMAKEDAGEARPWMTAVHRDQYGPCEFYRACFELAWDPTLMAHEYVSRPSATDGVRSGQTEVAEL